MARFQYHKEGSSTRNIWVSLALALCIIGIFYFAVVSFGGSTDEEQKKSLEQALNRASVHCYCTEGYYPESLLILKEDYGITYDEDKFFVDYQVTGQNIMPDITVIARK